jgi:hypothetical protein
MKCYPILIAPNQLSLTSQVNINLGGFGQKSPLRQERRTVVAQNLLSPADLSGSIRNLLL